MGQTRIEISAVLYQEDTCWIAQGLDYDITAQAPSLPDLYNRFAMKIVSEIVISLDLKKQPLEGIPRAPELFWRMFEEATMTVSVEPPSVRIVDSEVAPQIIPHMKIGQRAGMAA